MSIYFIIIYAILGIYMILNFKYDLQMFQQNSYRIPRYWRWLKNNFASAWRLTDLAGIFLIFSTLLPAAGSGLLVALMALVKIYLIFTKKYKKPLVFTRRVWRLYSVTAILSAGGYLAMIFAGLHRGPVWDGYATPVLIMGYLLLVTICSFIPVIIADILLMPVEKMIQQRYINDAKRILRSMPDLKIVGITGSYGKTSTKHYLHRILSEKFDVLMTPGSFNTPMGVVRTVREHMKPYNEVFICEMGAKQKGDIKEICDIVHPQMGIVTAVGPMHLESFKSIENVQATKFELVDALPADGLAVINNDFEMCAKRQVNNVAALRYAVTHPKGANYKAVDVKYTPRGTTFTVVGPDNFELPLETRLLGECNVSDLLAAVCIAVALGVDKDKIRYAVSSIEQVEHRLSIKRTPGGVTIIDDAFNSNPAGSKMAVDVLSHFTGGKRIIVTPGMIELGEEQFNLNKNLGTEIGRGVDIAIIVGEYNRQALEEGVKASGLKEENLYLVDSFNEAQQLLTTILAPGDTVLYENDLPDTFK
ncbi:MAG: UDP-N-acetylmuramoyl-tripeptide--D-alanyl-D-alanine ligase [Muribaculaceae bacterium]|nr:UDP-N-acetylmuramoyl-tripeptide--D-alanyl-D-alanine ligase [Muribaculaceae bacterium]